MITVMKFFSEDDNLASWIHEVKSEGSVFYVLKINNLNREFAVSSSGDQKEVCYNEMHVFETLEEAREAIERRIGKETEIV